jgi:hypothetical protein
VEDPSAQDQTDIDPATTDAAAKNKFFFPRATYRGKFTPRHLAFNANLQEFAQQVSLLCNLETAGKISPDDTYQEIKQLWHELRTSKHQILDAEEPPA